MKRTPEIGESLRHRFEMALFGRGQTVATAVGLVEKVVNEGPTPADTVAQAFQLGKEVRGHGMSDGDAPSQDPKISTSHQNKTSNAEVAHQEKRAALSEQAAKATAEEIYARIAAGDFSPISKPAQPQEPEQPKQTAELGQGQDRIVEARDFLNQIYNGEK